LEPACGADDPDHTNEQYHAEDVLNAREIDAERGAKFLNTQHAASIYIRLAELRSTDHRRPCGTYMSKPNTILHYYAFDRKEEAISVAFVRLSVRPSVRRVHSE